MKDAHSPAGCKFIKLIEAESLLMIAVPSIWESLIIKTTICPVLKSREGRKKSQYIWPHFWERNSWESLQVNCGRRKTLILMDESQTNSFQEPTFFGPSTLTWMRSQWRLSSTAKVLPFPGYLRREQGDKWNIIYQTWKEKKFAGISSQLQKQQQDIQMWSNVTRSFFSLRWWFWKTSWKSTSVCADAWIWVWTPCRLVKLKHVLTDKHVYTQVLSWLGQLLKWLLELEPLALNRHSYSLCVMQEELTKYSLVFYSTDQNHLKRQGSRHKQENWLWSSLGSFN